MPILPAFANRFFIRKKCIFAFVLVIFLIYFLSFLLDKQEDDFLDDDFFEYEDSDVDSGLMNDGVDYEEVMKEIVSDTEDVENVQFEFANDTDNSTLLKTCRNSLQGKLLITDEKGFVCQRDKVLPNGCCDTSEKTITRYSCDSCNERGCCGIYENCVSCCLDPSKKLGKTKFSDGGRSGSKLRKGKKVRILKESLKNLDRFQLCLMACRTSSASVRFESTYKSPDAKYCYVLQLSSAHFVEKY